MRNPNYSCWLKWRHCYHKDNINQGKTLPWSLLICPSYCLYILCIHLYLQNMFILDKALAVRKLEQWTKHETLILPWPSTPDLCRWFTVDIVTDIHSKFMVENMVWKFRSLHSISSTFQDSIRISKHLIPLENHLFSFRHSRKWC